jgi:hypothetical protein
VSLRVRELLCSSYAAGWLGGTQPTGARTFVGESSNDWAPTGSVPRASIVDGSFQVFTTMARMYGRHLSRSRCEIRFPRVANRRGCLFPGERATSSLRRGRSPARLAVIGACFPRVGIPWVADP